jgi:hypothetical protein
MKVTTMATPSPRGVGTLCELRSFGRSEQVAGKGIASHDAGQPLLPPHAQVKLVYVVSGAVYDVAVDMRRSSPAFGRWVGAELAADNHRQLWIPPCFADGFLVLSDTADFYKGPPITRRQKPKRPSAGSTRR